MERVCVRCECVCVYDVDVHNEMVFYYLLLRAVVVHWQCKLIRLIAFSHLIHESQFHQLLSLHERKMYVCR